MSASSDTPVECAAGLWSELLAELLCSAPDGSSLPTEPRLQRLLLLDDVRDLAILTAAMKEAKEARDLKLLVEAKLKVKARLGRPPAGPHPAPDGDRDEGPDEAEERDAALRRAARRILGGGVRNYGLTAKAPRTPRGRKTTADDFWRTAKTRRAPRGRKRTPDDFRRTAKTRRAWRVGLGPAPWGAGARSPPGWPVRTGPRARAHCGAGVT